MCLLESCWKVEAEGKNNQFTTFKCEDVSTAAREKSTLHPKQLLLSENNLTDCSVLKVWRSLVIFAEALYTHFFWERQALCDPQVDGGGGFGRASWVLRGFLKSLWCFSNTCQVLGYWSKTFPVFGFWSETFLMFGYWVKHSLCLDIGVKHSPCLDIE